MTQKVGLAIGLLYIREISRENLETYSFIWIRHSHNIKCGMYRNKVCIYLFFSVVVIIMEYLIFVLFLCTCDVFGVCLLCLDLLWVVRV